MIGSLRGVLLDRFASGEALIEVNGVGYRVTMAAPTLAGLGDLGNAVFVHVHTHVREDALVLYGFATREERTCFEALLSAHGVGPALGLAILSALSPASLARAVATDDVDSLTMIPGVGKKTAARLLLELKAKLDIDIHVDLVPVGATPAKQTPVSEVRAALAGLGYGVDEVRLATQGLPDDDGATVEDLLKTALRQLAVAAR